MDRRRFLSLARCPLCAAALADQRGSLLCGRGHRFEVNPHGIPIFAAAQPARSRAQWLAAEEMASVYATMRAFAFEAIGRGEAEGLYRCAGDLLRRGLKGRRVEAILDLGCGAGRTLVDAATAFPRALVIGIDQDDAALEVAYAVACLRGPALEADLRRWGLGRRVLTARGLGNVFLAQARADQLPFVAAADGQGFDAVISVNLLDRVEQPLAVLGCMARLLRADGLLVLTTPLNWQAPGGEPWQQLADLEGLRGAVEACDLTVEVAFDGLLYREIQDVRGSALDWRVAVVVARRVSSS